MVPYEVVDSRIKDANRESAIEFIKALQLFGIFLEPPVLEHDEGIIFQNNFVKFTLRTHLKCIFVLKMMKNCANLCYSMLLTSPLDQLV